MRIIATSLLLVLGCLSARGQSPPDLRFQQSPAKPAPDWVKIVDYGQFDPRLKGYFVPEGIKIEIVAEEPEVINPVGMTFGPDGTLYVLEWVEAKDMGDPKTEVEFVYKDGSKRKVLIARKPIKDHVKALVYNVQKGVYDSAKIVLEDELPSSILFHDGWLYLSGQGTVRRYRQTQPGGAWDKKEIIAQGFCGYHNHQVSGLTIGNDGWLYITAGDNDNFVEGSDGSRATVLRTGAIFRCRPDGSNLHTYSIGYRNPYRDVSFDATFNMFHADNDNDDGSNFTGCRLMHIPEGVDFGWRLRPGAICCLPDVVRGAFDGELPGKVTPMLKTGRGATAGLCIYNDSYFPSEYRGLLLYPDMLNKVIRAYKTAPKGATFEVTEEFELLRSHDPLFRPCQMVVGPDGAIYVCDWRSDPGSAGKLWGDGKHGRIYRLSWKGTPDKPALPLRPLDSWAKIVKQSEDDLLKKLESANFSDRLRAQQELARRGEKSRASLLKILQDEDTKPTPARIAALGALQSMWDADVKSAFIARLGDFEMDMRRLAADGLALHCRATDQDAHEALVQHIADEDLAVRRAVFLAIGRINVGDAADFIVSALQNDKHDDAYFSDGLVRALEHTGKNGISHLLALADSGSLKDLGTVVEIYPSFRTRAAAEKLPSLLQNYHVTPEQKIALIRSYLYYQLDPPVSVEPLVKFFESLSDQPTKKISEIQINGMKLAAMEVLAAAGKVNTERLEQTLIGMLKTDDPKARRAIMRALANIDDRSVRKVAERLLGDEDVQVQREAVVLLGQQADGARLIGNRFVANQLPRNLLPVVVEALRRFANAEHPDIQDLLKRVEKGKD